jgi:uncharacterized protein YecE (DUF72 family)
VGQASITTSVAAGRRTSIIDDADCGQRLHRSRSRHKRATTIGRMSGRLYVGTSGFGYPAWAPRFYSAGARGEQLLPLYAARLPAVELNGTYYRQPLPQTIAGWCAATPPGFRFVVKALRTGSMRAFATDPEGTLPWLLSPARRFEERLGAVLFRIGERLPRDDARLERLLAAWPRAVPLVLEFQDASWQDDEVFARLVAAGAVLCATELEAEAEPPMIRRTGAFLYLRLRRDDYDEAAIDAWAARLEPFLADGTDAYVFFKHDAVGRGGELALALGERLAAFAP